MRITELNDLTEQDHKKINNVAVELNQRLRSLLTGVVDQSQLLTGDGEIRPEVETVFLPKFPGEKKRERGTEIERKKGKEVERNSEGAPRRRVRDASVGTEMVGMKDRAVKTDQVKCNCSEQKVKLEMKETGRKLKEKVKADIGEEVKEKVVTRDQGINTQIMGQIVAGKMILEFGFKSNYTKLTYC